MTLATAARDAALRLLAQRADDATVCPSEVARAIAPPAGWRAAMPDVHDAVDALVADGLVTLSWKGQALARRTGPYRVALSRIDPRADPGAGEAKRISTGSHT